jgi:hypothetical protein
MNNWVEPGWNSKKTNYILSQGYKNYREPFANSSDATTLIQTEANRLFNVYCGSAGTLNPAKSNTGYMELSGVYNSTDGSPETKRTAVSDYIKNTYERATNVNLDINKTDSEGGRKTSFNKCFGVNINEVPTQSSYLQNNSGTAGRSLTVGSSLTVAPGITPQNISLSLLQYFFEQAGCSRKLNETDVAWWRGRSSLQHVQADMNEYGRLTENCSGEERQHEFCIPNKCSACNRKPLVGVGKGEGIGAPNRIFVQDNNYQPTEYALGPKPVSGGFPPYPKGIGYELYDEQTGGNFLAKVTGYALRQDSGPFHRYISIILNLDRNINFSPLQTIYYQGPSCRGCDTFKQPNPDLQEIWNPDNNGNTVFYINNSNGSKNLPNPPGCVGWTVTVSGQYLPNGKKLKATVATHTPINDRYSGFTFVNNVIPPLEGNDQYSFCFEDQLISNKEKVKFYSKCGYQGKETELGIGEYNLRKLLANGYINDTLQSVKIPPGMAVIMWDNDLNSGREVRLDTSNECLSSIDYMNRVSSCRVIQV